jgi:hypothetical protein
LAFRRRRYVADCAAEVPCDGVERLRLRAGAGASQPSHHPGRAPQQLLRYAVTLRRRRARGAGGGGREQRALGEAGLGPVDDTAELAAAAAEGGAVAGRSDVARLGEGKSAGQGGENMNALACMYILTRGINFGINTLRS